MLSRYQIAFLSILVFSFTGAATADEDSARVASLARQVEQLATEVAELKKSIETLNDLKPSLTMMMPDIAERLHVMHYAGEAQDWAVASHEFQAIQVMLGMLGSVDSVKGAMANGFMAEPIKALNSAIDHEDADKFNQALEMTVENCNSCHVAAGSPTMKITLEGADALSLRHSHDFIKSRNTMGGHMH